MTKNQKLKAFKDSLYKKLASLEVASLEADLHFLFGIIDELNRTNRRCVRKGKKDK